MSQRSYWNQLCGSLFLISITIVLLSTSVDSQEPSSDITHHWLTFSAGKGFAKSNKTISNVNIDFNWGKKLLFYRVGLDHTADERPGVEPWLTTISVGVGFAKIEKELPTVSLHWP
ncbi:MAG: hypothetical protein AAFP70_01510 [Calditrichota bacterium]